MSFELLGEWGPKATMMQWPRPDNRQEHWREHAAVIGKEFARLIQTIIQAEPVYILYHDQQSFDELSNELHIDGGKFPAFIRPINVPLIWAWARDNGPLSLVDRKKNRRKMIGGNFNAWGNQWVSDLDRDVPRRLAALFKTEYADLPQNLILEGGAIDSNGAGTCLSTKSVLLKRNKHSEATVRQILRESLNCRRLILLHAGLEHDETDGHIDNVARFVSEDTVLAVTANKRSDPNYDILQSNLRQLRKEKTADGTPLNVIELPCLPSIEYIQRKCRCAASFANFIFVEGGIIVPTYPNTQNEEREALQIFEDYFRDRKIIPFDAQKILEGGGSLHCVTMQLPAVMHERTRRLSRSKIR